MDVVGFVVNGEAVRPATAQAVRDVTPSDLAMLRSQFRGGNVLLPNDPSYGQVKFFNGRYDHIKPSGIIQPTTDEGVREAVNLMMKNGIRFSVKGGGHHYEGFSKSSGVVIDLSKLKFDIANQKLEPPIGSKPGTPGSLVTVGAGNVLSELYYGLATKDGTKNRVMPAGTSDTVGAIGHALGGGFADMAPHLGYAAQNLEQVRLVTYTGKMLDINDHGISEIRDGKAYPYTGNITGADFMRALRGGGQALAGIVTQAKFKTHDMSGQDMRFFKIEATNSMSKESTINAVSAWQKWQTSHPEFDKLVSSKLYLNGSGNSLNMEVSGVIATKDPAMVQAIQRSFAEFASQMKAPKTEVSQTPQNMWQIFNKYKDDDVLTKNTERRQHIVRSAMVPNQISSGGIRHLIENMSGGGSNVAIYALGGATLDGIKEKTSLPPAKFVTEMEIKIPRGAPTAAAQQRIDDYHQGFMKAAGLQYNYANYPGGGGRYVTDPGLIQRIRNEFDPRHVAQNPLADRPQDTRPDPALLAQTKQQPAQKPKSQA